MQKQKLSQSDFARLTGIDQSLISKWLKGQRNPDADHRICIEKVTDGVVTVESWSRARKAA